MAGLHMLCLQVVRIGEHTGPLSIAELRLLSIADLDLLNQASEYLDTVDAQRVEKELKARGRSDSPSS
jgi:phage FluMu protein gp41